MQRRALELFKHGVKTKCSYVSDVDYNSTSLTVVTRKKVGGGQRGKK